jgi:cadmium resistance protein CadD (predicted permease)
MIPHPPVPWNDPKAKPSRIIYVAVTIIAIVVCVGVLFFSAGTITESINDAQAPSSYVTFAFNFLSLGLFILAATFIIGMLAGTTCAGPDR